MSTGGDSHTWEKYPVSPTFSQIAPWEDTPNHYVPQGMGSNAWRGVQDYDPNMARYQRAVDTLKYVRWDILLENCTRVRNGITCRLEERFSVGNFKLVRRITFEDGYSWVVKVRMPPLDWQYDTEVMNDAKQIASEVANLKYLKYVIANSVTDQNVDIDV